MTSDSNRNQETEFKQLKLISVTFKEASLDSPSFRATVNYFEHRIDIFQKLWLEKISEFIREKYSPAFQNFETHVGVMVSNMDPLTKLFNTGMISNQLYTPILVDNTTSDYSELQTHFTRTLIRDGSVLSECLTQLNDNCISVYRTSRKKFEKTQKIYDDLLFKSNILIKPNLDVDPEASMKMAFAIFEAKMKYLKAALDLVDVIASTKLQLDEFVVNTISRISDNNTIKQKFSSEVIDLSPKMTKYVNDYKQWMLRTANAAKELKSEIESAKKQIYDYVEERARPSTDILEYTISRINSESLINKKIFDLKVRKAPEKAGWLFMKTYIGSSTKPTWVRNWCFIQNSVFGMFVLSDTKTYVQETDKFGVLLTHVRYEPDEDRKYCFEVKILGNKYSEETGDNEKDLTIVFHTESLRELKSWLTAFALAQRYVLGLNKNSYEYDVAFRRFSPDFLEFASTSSNSVEKMITSNDDNTRSLLELLNAEFSEYDSLKFANEELSKIYIQSTMISTKLSKLATFSHLFQNSNWLPSAPIANIWGVTNWTAYSVLDSSTILKGMTTDSVEDYPPNYPNAMKISDIEFKSIFFSIDHRVLKYPDLLILFKFSSFWCPNERQSFSTICYVTDSHIYCFTNTNGFISLLKNKIANIQNIEQDKNESNLLHFHDSNGPYISIYIHFDEPKVILTKLKYLTKNRCIKQPKQGSELYSILSKIETTILNQKKEETERLENELITRSKPNQSVKINEEAVKSFWDMNEESYNTILRSKELQDKSTAHHSNTYEIGSKGLTHIIFGNRSDAFPTAFYLAKKKKVYDKNIGLSWMRDVDEKTGEDILYRTLSIELSLFDRLINVGSNKVTSVDSNSISVKQRFVKALENNYYEIEQSPIYIKLPLCRLLRGEQRYTITEPYDPEYQIASKFSIPNSKSFLTVFYNINIIDAKTGNVVTRERLHEKIMKKLVISRCRYEYMWLKKVIKYYLERIGKHGRTIKAIKMCGDFTPDPAAVKDDITKNSVKNDDEKVIIVYSYTLILRIILKYAFSKFANVILLSVRGMFGIVQLLGTGFADMSKFSLILLFFTILLNSFLSSRSNLTYWTTKRVNVFFDNFLKEDNNDLRMDRLIMLHEDELIGGNGDYNSNESLPAWLKYKQKMFHDTEFKENRYEISSKRNKILIELKLLKNMERELVHERFQEFLEKEIERCNLLKENAGEVISNDPKLSNYCKNCEEEYDNLKSLLL
ncbi:hypothetical protein TPHA_0B04320 [Tetrapisispora phaffii CBS 4417]|uniref:PH domain-containing protein n=1 Tax=Tetrapisispora phaffii (strain ATCC 24235 / CBS 4417 / NBRC 1672 / NRRL Y-8282 / UCD 70-5) TaxID=1071381 RepID=G8BQ20_TETPH|nr:hypothetical protein TPHA_0B04320 [Tetrapisispora phaffii CBS 4417]CCE62101.1 hypothetical protein TPHA_0B04320 [Tetrapisispora phaffii CBS 4417]